MIRLKSSIHSPIQILRLRSAVWVMWTLDFFGWLGVSSKWRNSRSISDFWFYQSMFVSPWKNLKFKKKQIPVNRVFTFVSRLWKLCPGKSPWQTLEFWHSQILVEIWRTNVADFTATFLYITQRCITTAYNHLYVPNTSTIAL